MAKADVAYLVFRKQNNVIASITKKVGPVPRITLNPSRPLCL